MSSIEKFVARINRDVVSTIQNHDADSFASLDDIAIVASMPNSNLGFLSLFTDFAHEYRDRYSFAVMEAESTSVTCTNKIDLTQHSTAEMENVNALREILRICTEPLIPALTRRNEMNYMSVSAAFAWSVLLLTRSGWQVSGLLLYGKRR